VGSILDSFGAITHPLPQGGTDLIAPQVLMRASEVKDVFLLDLIEMLTIF
jgi:hypothetical protein